jgi:hypothetical protein
VNDQEVQLVLLKFAELKGGIVTEADFDGLADTLEDALLCSPEEARLEDALRVVEQMTGRR